MKITQIVRAFLLICLFLPLAACVNPGTQDGPPDNPPKSVAHIPNAMPKYEPKSRYGNPKSYVVMGKRYHVLPSAQRYNQRGIASWYGKKFNGRLTSTRERYDMYGMTAASPVLPIPSYARVTNLSNGQSVIVKVNDRGPFAPNRILDLSYAAARKLDMIRNGTALVQVTTINVANPNATPAPVKLAHTPELYLQLGAFRQYANANSFKKIVLKYTNKPVVIKNGKYQGKLIYKVQIGPLIGVGESDKLHARLEKNGIGNAMTVIS